MTRFAPLFGREGFTVQPCSGAIFQLNDSSFGPQVGVTDESRSYSHTDTQKL